MHKRNNWSAKLIRTLTSVLPIARNRKGKCRHCGACCKLPNVCPFLRHRKNGMSYCSTHIFKPFNCRKYPRTQSEHITQETCGFRFE